MPPRNAICIVIDGLRASALGTYGNTWYGTPALDQFAAQSIVAEWMWTGAPELDSFYREAWDGFHALRPRKPTIRSTGSPIDSAGLADAVPLPLRLAAAGFHQTLVTDDLWLDRYAERMSVDQHLWDVNWLDTDVNQPAPAIADTALGKVFAAAIEKFEGWQDCQTDRGNLLWLHARGMQGPWDAPEVMRWELVEEDQVQPPTWVTPPRQEMGDDPDQWLGLRIAYAAQTMVLDACLGALLSALDEMQDPALVMLVGSRGFALGEHGSAGSECRDLYGELLHVPWLLRVPDGVGEPPPRFTGLTQTFDLTATLRDWFGLEALGDGHSLLAARIKPSFDYRQVVVVRDGGGQQVVRTPAWMLRQMGADEGGLLSPQLYAKPDDRWEVNDVASRCPRITEGLLAVLAEHEQRLITSTALEPYELDSELLP